MASVLHAISSAKKQTQDNSFAAWLSFIQALPARFIHRLRTGGVRFLAQLIFANLAIVGLFRFLTADQGHRYQAVFPWASSPDNGVPGIDGGLRIVAFGSQDVFGSAARSDESSRTWLQTLCDELKCSSLHSFVPHHDSGRALAFTDIYKKEVEELKKHTEETDLLKDPAADYSWLESQYPVPTQAPDLPAQVDTFLSLPLPEDVPRQTLWVFTFGSWDIWNLAALPMDRGLSSVVKTIDRLVEYLEMLNFKSLDPESVAFSDFWSNATAEDVKHLAGAKAPDKVDVRRLESFRVLIPQLFDISLTPGWQDRPAPLFPHTRGEQMRNAAVLTKLWNKTLRKKLEHWELKGSSKPNVTEHNDGSLTVAPMPLDEDGGKKKRSEITKRDMPKREVIYAPYPRRMAYQPGFAKDIVDAMTEEGMQRAKVEDSLGHGTWPLNDTMRFLDVWEPCLKVVQDEASIVTECQNPQDHLFLDGFTVGQRASDEIAKSIAARVVTSMFRKRSPKAKR
ncbi:hypothetical protein NLU13_3407 [Sarocladium strictum]|uniref:Uncharacterized protein n=1 Tax=Sarocladium strictum TaxID=5046 RepID=A0AA39GMR9_SARSR|nr:hypothetical protein NLU13_3407 [Sarocladium strictum]